MRVSICQEKIGQPKLKVRVKHIRLETMMNSLKLNVDGTVNVATKNIFYAMRSFAQEKKSQQAPEIDALVRDRKVFARCHKIN